VRPGRTIASLEFAVPSDPVARAAWEAYVRIGLPALGRLISPGWTGAGDFLGGSIKGFWTAYPIERQLELWGEAGVGDVSHRTMSLGGGIVIWGRKA
jgi:hypothetical protein